MLFFCEGWPCLCSAAVAAAAAAAVYVGIVGQDALQQKQRAESFRPSRFQSSLKK